jgi:hypothetical protein
MNGAPDQRTMAMPAGQLKAHDGQLMPAAMLRVR